MPGPFPVLHGAQPRRVPGAQTPRKKGRRTQTAPPIFDHLLDLLDRHGAPHPPAGATHIFRPDRQASAEMGESHTEFVTYTIFGDGVADNPVRRPHLPDVPRTIGSTWAPAPASPRP